jgi:hypothetical protein
MTSDELTTTDRDLLFRAVTLAGGQWIGVQKPLIAGLPEWLVFRNPSTKRILSTPLHIPITASVLALDIQSQMAHDTKGSKVSVDYVALRTISKALQALSAQVDALMDRR